ncbi:DUF1631 family protein [Sessilibacter sp. MAH4]
MPNDDMNSSNPLSQTNQTAAQLSNAEKQLVARLKSCQKITCDFTEDQFRPFYNALDERIAQAIRNASTNAEQRYFYDVQRHLRHNIEELKRHLIGYIGESFVKFKSGNLDTHANINEKTNLSLVENEALEEEIAISSAARRADTKYVEILWSIQKRFSELINQQPVNDSNNPVAPIQFCDALRRALGVLKLESKVKLLAYEEFERTFTNELESLLEQINRYLVGEGILPELNFHQQGSAQVAKAVAASEFDTNIEANGDFESAYLQAQQNNPEASLKNQTNLMRAIREIQNFGAPEPTSQAPQPTHFANPVPLQSLMGFNGNFAALNQTNLSGGSPPVMGGAAGGRHMQVITNQQLVGALQAMQEQILNIRQAGVEALQPVDVAAVTAQLSEELAKENKDGAVEGKDMHVIELVGMLFDYMLSDDCLPDNIKALLSYLHTPYLKVAFMDPEFFEQAEHPARLLLNNLAEAGVRWVSNDGSNQYEIYDKIKAIVSSILEEFKDDVKLFAELLVEFSSYTKKILRKQELMEKRAMEKVHGEEKLREVKIRVNAEVRKRTDGKEMPSAVLLLLLQPWSDYLSFILLRFGTESEQWRRAVSAVDDVIWAVAPKQSANERARQMEMQAELLDYLEAGLETIGYDQVKGRKLIDAVTALQKAALAQKTVEVAPAPMRSKLEAMAEKKAGTPVQAKEKLSEDEARLVESLKMIEFGTWFEFDKGRRLKVAWYNSKTSHYMLVDQTGKKVGMKTGLELARDMIARKARVIVGSTKPFFERALENIFETMNTKKASAGA